ncbi:hypothetical protein F8388_023437 [Cannabis sativa]|uniref:Reverse transcriptase zinc-binding domain-containing protein n=1 Tax=Cannabis sativa TaxID=3483 RepID=A0A7J6FKW8_CANSA|nr:hypothetical protein F8388_023437 [Cannabis sativa]
MWTSYPSYNEEVKKKIWDQKITGTSMYQEERDFHLSKQVWCRLNVPKHNFILWIAVQNKLRTRDRLQRFNIAADSCCLLCNTATESIWWPPSSDDLFLLAGHEWTEHDGPSTPRIHVVDVRMHDSQRYVFLHGCGGVCWDANELVLVDLSSFPTQNYPQINLRLSFK